jgi:hypothetical protein
LASANGPVTVVAAEPAATDAANTTRSRASMSAVSSGVPRHDSASSTMTVT